MNVVAQIAALGTTMAFLAGHDMHDPVTYFWSLAFTIAGAATFAFTRVHRDTRIPQEAIIGIVTEPDIVRKVVGTERMPYFIPVEEIMSSPVRGIDERRPITEAADLMEHDPQRVLPTLIMSHMPKMTQVLFFGALLTGFGLTTTSSRMYAEHSLGINVNLWSGLAMLAFGADRAPVRAAARHLF